MNEIKHCRNCAHWHWTGDFRGNCWVQRWASDKFSQDATPYTSQCKDYAERCTEAVSAKEG